MVTQLLQSVIDRRVSDDPMFSERVPRAAAAASRAVRRAFGAALVFQRPLCSVTAFRFSDTLHASRTAREDLVTVAALLSPAPLNRQR